MLINFDKYQGTGNDFIMVDGREQELRIGQEAIARLCDRRFGIGADGLIFLKMEGNTPRMVYYNADGAEGSMCGNGGRCFVAFLEDKGISGSSFFLAFDGQHEFRTENGLISLKMGDVDQIEHIGDDLYLDTGSPHYVRQVHDLNQMDVVREGRAIRNGEKFSKKGTNVDFIELKGDGIEIRTYERGVEDETLSCGTGATASAIALHHSGAVSSQELTLTVKGGQLIVNFNPMPDGRYANIWLSGLAQKVFSGTITTSL